MVGAGKGVARTKSGVGGGGRGAEVAGGIVGWLEITANVASDVEGAMVGIMGVGDACGVNSLLESSCHSVATISAESGAVTGAATGGVER